MIANSRVKTHSLTTTVGLLLGESSDRKSVTIQNRSSSITVYLCNNKGGFAAGDWFGLAPNSTVTILIPEDNPREPVWARTASSTAVVKTWEWYAKK